MAVLKQPAKVLRILGPKDDAAWERALVGIYDALDQLTSTAFAQDSDTTNIIVQATGTKTTPPSVPGSDPSEEARAPDLAVPPKTGPRMLGIMQFSAHYNASFAVLFCNDYGGTGAVGDPSTASANAWFYGMPTPCVLRNLRVYFRMYSAIAGATVTLYRTGSPTTLTLTETGTGAFIDSAHSEVFLGGQLLDCMVTGNSGGEPNAIFDISVTVEAWSVN